jgi:hypothetical protein
MSRKAVGSRPNEVIELFSIYLILPATLGPGVYSASIRNEYQNRKKKVLERRVQLVCKDDNLTTICELIV